MLGRGWYKRRLPVFSPLPARPSGPRPSPPKVIRFDQRRNGAFFRAPWIAPHVTVNVAGGVLPPWVCRGDYEREGRIFWMRPFLKAPPPPVAGGVPQGNIFRWDFERAGLFYREKNYFVVPVVPPPVLVISDGATWFAGGRSNVWNTLLRALSWRADVATFLTKRTGETRLYAMDFSALPELQNNNLSGVVSVVAVPLTVGASNVALTNPALGSNGKTALVWISGGVSGASYKITFTVTVAGGTILEDFGYLLVEDE